MNTESGERKTNWGQMAALFAARMVADVLVFAGAVSLTESVIVGAAGLIVPEALYTFAALKASGLE